MTLAPTTRFVRVWSVPVRVAHWSVAVLMLFNLFNDAGGRTHRYAGYAAAAFVAARGIYGLFQRGRPAGWHQPTPAACLAHLRAMFSGHPPRLEGHNPLGAAMSILLWSLVLGLAATGWISRWDRFWGEDWPVEIHAGLSLALKCAVLLHLAGVAVSSLLERQNLVVSMLTGWKKVDR